MLARPPPTPLALLVLLAACPGGDDDTTATTTGSTSATATVGTTAGTTTATASSGLTEPTTEPTSAGSGSADATGTPDTCDSRPEGGWNDCAPDGPTNNTLCNYVANGAAGDLTCLSPQSGDYNVCGIRDCVDDCDCFAPPSTGTAIATCTVVFGGGGKGCVLYCLNGQVCPDGMECVSGTCYWPH